MFRTCSCGQILEIETGSDWDQVVCDNCGVNWDGKPFDRSDTEHANADNICTLNKMIGEQQARMDKDAERVRYLTHDVNNLTDLLGRVRDSVKKHSKRMDAIMEIVNSNNDRLNLLIHEENLAANK